MPAVTRLGDKCTGHDSCPAVKLANCYSKNVAINGIPVGLVGDTYEPHGCSSHDTHVGSIATGSPNVTINGRAVGRVGDSVSCGGTVAEGSPSVFIGDGQSSDDLKLAQFNLVKDLIETQEKSGLYTLTDEEKIILCLPDIAENMATQADNAADCQGWLYLADMFRKWISGKANTVAKNNPDPFVIDWDWAMQYKDEADAKDYLLENAFNKNGQASLTKVLEDNLDLTAGGSIAFDFTGYSTPEELEKYYFQHRGIDGEYGIFFLNGNSVALGAHTIRALAKGSVDCANKTVTVTGLSLFIHDVFNFDESFSGWFLGYWNCEKLDFSLVSTSLSFYLSNSTFRSFRQKTGFGQDFIVLSNKSEFEEVFNYDYTT